MLLTQHGSYRLKRGVWGTGADPHFYEVEGDLEAEYATGGYYLYCMTASRDTSDFRGELRYFCMSELAKEEKVCPTKEDSGYY